MSGTPPTEKSSTDQGRSPIAIPTSFSRSISTETPTSSELPPSTGSGATIRGNVDIQSPSISLRTPSFPFPSIGIDSGTPLATPPAHLPFTALSPTVTPGARGLTASKLAKSRVVDEFKASGRIQPFDPHHPLSASQMTGVSLPEPHEIAIRLQIEPGLSGWWQQVTQILKESFHATRATLAIPSDRTEIENVPWAQLAEYYANDDEDSLSRATAEGGSTRSSLSGPSPISDPSQSERRQDDDLSANPSITTNLARPKLDSRHSFAGYPRRSPSSETPTLASKRPRPHRAETQTSLIGNLLDSRTFRELDKSQPHQPESILSPLSEGTTNSSLLPARILEIPRPLELDTEPLITSAGVVRVLNNSSATILTRRYNIIDEPPSPTSQRLPSHGSQSKLQHSVTDVRHRPPSSKRTRSHTGSTTRSSTGSSIEVNKFSGYITTAYEDFEQIPGTPWAQSPAPSPAAIADTEDNPFFPSTSMQQSFHENPPTQQYTSGQHFEAIGIDSSYSIIQLPLVHPSTLLSQPQRLHRARIEVAKDRRIGKTDRYNKDHAASIERKRKIPLAILSILAPIAPFPQELVHFLNSLSPMFATSFHAANQHSNLQKEVSGLAYERNRATARLPMRLQHTDSQGSEILSPISANSNEWSVTGANTPQKPGKIAIDKLGRDSDRSYPRTPGLRTPSSASARDGYFTSMDSVENDPQKKTAPARHSSTRTKPGHSTSQKKPQSTLHSQGASFHKTHPSLPVATAIGQSADELSDSDAGARPFKEPSSSMLRSMIDIGATQHLIAEPDSGRLLWVNSKFQAYRNSSAAQKLDDLLWNNIYYKDRRNFRREWMRALETGEQLSQQVRMERFDGQFRWFHLKFLPLKNDMGVIKYWSGQAMDIHDLHEAEVKAAKSKEKSASEAKYRAIANSLPVIVFAASVPTGMTFANTQWLSYSGQSLNQALGFGFLDHVHPEDLHKCRFPGLDDDAPVTSPFKQDPKFSAKRAGLRRNDSATSSAGDSDATSAITERTVIPGDRGPLDDSVNMQIPNELLRGLIKEGIILCAPDGQGNLSITTEMRLKSKDNEYRWHLVQGSYIQSVDFGSGEAQWFIACTDISAQKKNEAKIQEANSALESVNAALEREMQQKMGYLSSMSHEIRTPLNSIIGNLQFLVQSGLEESALEWAHGAKEAATGMHELINDILDLSKAEAKMLKLQPHWFDPRDLGEQVMDILNPKAAGKKVELCQETASTIPQTIRGDAGRIKQVLLNLATNAIKFTNEGEVIVRCEPQGEVPAELGLPPLKENETYIRWTVTDTGIGFSQADRKLLFKAYSQIKNKATRDTVGTGLGLILCKTMVNLHGGDIDATSIPGKGSTFSFFARFRIRVDSLNVGSRTSSMVPSAATTPLPVPLNMDSQSRLLQSPASLRESPALLSDSSSALSIRSSLHQRSLRSSISTLESLQPQSPLKLSLPADSIPSPNKETNASEESAGIPPVTSKSQPKSRHSIISSSVKPELVSPVTVSVKTIPSIPGVSASRSGSGDTESDKMSITQGNDTLDSDRASFRPPMLSVLVICPANETRRITCERIQSIVPRSAPCNIASEATFAAAYNLLFGEEPILFTHVVVLTVVNKDATECVERLLNSPIHNQTCLVLLTDPDQFVTIRKSLPQIDFDVLNQADRIKKVLKPAHPSKLAKIFDPFNENRTVMDDPKENKRKAGERRTKEDFKLFKQALGGKGIRILAVEDDKMQMNVLNSFLSKVCGLATTKAFNGQECLTTYLENGPGYFSVIVSDTEMPVMNGLAMCRQIRKEEARRGWPPINLVSLSANVLTKGWAEAADAGFSHYCGKPVSFSELGRLLIELTDPKLPHRYLRDRPKPKALLQALGELDEDDDDDDEDDEDHAEYGASYSYSSRV